MIDEFIELENEVEIHSPLGRLIQLLKADYIEKLREENAERLEQQTADNENNADTTDNTSS